MRLLSAFNDAIELMRRWFNANVGNAWLSVIVTLLAVCALLLFWQIIKAAVGKTSVVIKWGKLILLIIVIVVLVWLCLMY